MPEHTLQPWVVARLVDETGSRAETRIHVRRSTSRDTGVSGAQQLAALISAVSSCEPIDTELQYSVKVHPVGTPAPGATRFAVGVLIFSTTAPDQYGIIEIPGITSGCIDPIETTRLLLTAPTLQAYITALVSGIFCNPFGYPLVECIAGLYELRQ